MAQLSENQTLPPQILASFFLKLAQMETAGISAIDSFALIKKTDNKLRKQLVIMQQFLISGLSIADAGYKVGIFNKTHKAIIHAAEMSGTLAQVYKLLATYYQDKDSRLKKIQSKLYLPLFMIVLALFVKPIPLLVNSEISFLSYLGLSLGRFLLMTVVIYVLFKLPLWFQSVFHNLEMKLPFIRDWIIKRQINACLFFLAILLDAGLAFEEAWPLAVATIENSELKKRLYIATRSNKTGNSVSTTLSRVNEISATTLQIIDTGEKSGKLAETMLHFSNIEAETIYLLDESLAEWFPRIFYFVVVLWMATSILGF